MLNHPYDTRSRSAASAQHNYRRAVGSPNYPTNFHNLGKMNTKICGNTTDFLPVCHFIKSVKDEAPTFFPPHPKIKLLAMPPKPQLWYVEKYPRIRTSSKKDSNPVPPPNTDCFKPIPRYDCNGNAQTEGTIADPTIAKSTRSEMKDAAPRDAALIHPETKTDPTSSDEMDFDADEPPPLIDASDSEDEDEATDTATTLSSDTSSAIDHYSIRYDHDDDRTDSDVEQSDAHLMNIASEKALRGFNQAQSIYIQECNLNLAQNNSIQ